MRYELMLPGAIRRAIAQNTPVVLPIGVLEYHGEHLGVGLDTLVVVRCLERLEGEGLPMVIMPPFYYGAGSYIVEGPKGNGTVQVDSGVLTPFAKELFVSLLRIGFRNIHGFIHHQSENFLQGMPTDLAFRLGARQATFEILGCERGEGWWGNETMSDYYGGHSEGDNPFNWIRVHPLMDEAIISSYEFDHAGIGETSLLMALDPDGVQMDKFTDERWYLRGADKATPVHGEEAVGKILARLRRILAMEVK